MPDYVRPNITVPVSLWGEVKVSAFRRGIKPVEVVIEMLREKFDDGYRKEKGLPSRASVQKLRNIVDGMGGKESVSPTKEPVLPTKPAVDQNTCKHHYWPGVRGCSKCGYIPPIV